MTPPPELPPQEDSDDGSLVRPYLITGGRTRTGVTDPAAIVLTVAAVRNDRATAGLQPEHLAVLGLCHEVHAVAEIAARLELQLPVVRVLLDDLVDRRLVQVTHVTTPDSDEMMLTKVLEGLRAL